DASEKVPSQCFFTLKTWEKGKRADVAKPIACTRCRECVMGPFGEEVELRRVKRLI
ncbi:hypothetical protein E2562_015943, partial [Oryza meyeriana var. granulata]